MNKPLRLLLILVLIVGLMAGTGYVAMRMLYPREYESEIAALSAEFGVEEALICAVVDCESGFRTDVTSDAGAVGLMQLTPDAFSWVQKKIDGADSLGADALFDPRTNLRYGVALLSLHLQEFGTVAEALAAYHAGRGRVNEWLNDPDLSPDGKTLASIPYGDTCSYVEKVVKTEKYYHFLYHI
ncbi:MAG: lytic transglycosylase domain-containing protein [Clostridia bacterium]|nr:lytic transglycosylase domain-containing protein [Clostridia bacterium]